jgi:hypothetical protein
MFAALVPCLVVASLSPSASAAEGTQPIAWNPPSGYERGGCAQGIGQRWNPPRNADWRDERGIAGPLYLAHDGRLTAVQYEIAVADMAAGGTWNGMGVEYDGRPLTVDHVDIRLIAAHAGFAEPHYGIFLILVSPAEQAAIVC